MFPYTNICHVNNKLTRAGVASSRNPSFLCSTTNAEQREHNRSLRAALPLKPAKTDYHLPAVDRLLVVCCKQSKLAQLS